MQQPRPSTQEVTRGLETTADKIRALAQAGYDRTEIGRELGIRYQHVRNVLLRSGITGGLRGQVQAEREPVIIDIPVDQSHESTSWEVLLRAGFQFLGEWAQDPESAIKLDAQAPAEPGVYAFAVNDVVVYVGLTQTGLRTRLNHYRLGHPRQRTSSRVKGLITTALAAGQRVKVMVATPAPSQWKGLPVNTAAGLEAGLIQMIRPAWNILGAT